VPDPFSIIDAAGTAPSLLTGQPAEAKQDPFAYIDSGGAPFDRGAAVTRQGLVKDPARAGRILRLRDRTGMPSDFLDRNLDEVEKITAAQDFDADSFRKESPLVAAWMAQSPEHAALARDDLPRLAALERFVSESPNYRWRSDGRIEQAPNPKSPGYGNTFTPVEMLKDLELRSEQEYIDQINLERVVGNRGAFVSGFQSAGMNTLAFTQMALNQIRAAGGLPKLDSIGTLEASGELSASSSIKDPGILKDIVRGTGGLVADIPLMGLGPAKLASTLLATRLAAKAFIERYAAKALVTAAIVQPLAIREGVITGAQHGWANGLAAWGIETAIPAAFGPTGTERVISQLISRGVAKETAPGLIHGAFGLLKETGLEATEESVTELAHAIHEATSGIDPEALDPARLGRRLVTAGAVGGIAGGGFNLPEAVARMLGKGESGAASQQLAQIDATMRGIAIVQAVSDAAKESAAAGANEAAAKTLWQTLVEKKMERVYIDPDAFARITGGKGLNPRAAAIEILAGPPLTAGARVDPRTSKAWDQAAQTYDDAVRTGSSIPFRTVDFGFWRSRHDDIAADLDQEIRVDPSAKTAREAEDEIAAMEQAQEDPGQVTIKSAKQEADDIAAEVSRQLVAGGMEQRAADASAMQLATRFRVTAAMWNKNKAADAPMMTPRQVYNEQGLEIKFPESPLLATPSYESAKMATARARATAQRQAAQEQMEQMRAEDQAKAQASQAADEALAQAAAGEEGARLVDEAMAKIQAARASSLGDVMLALGPDFGFRPDSKTTALTSDQEHRAAVFLLAIRSRGADLMALAEEAGAKRTPTEVTVDEAGAAPPVAEDIANNALALRDLYNESANPRSDLTPEQRVILNERGAALAKEVAPYVADLGLEGARLTEIELAVEHFIQDDPQAQREYAQYISRKQSLSGQAFQIPPGMTPQEAAAYAKARVADESQIPTERMAAKPKTDARTGLPLNPDGTVTVYHHTSSEAAEKIAKTGKLVSMGEPDVYVTTRKEADSGYGDTSIAIRVPPDILTLDDEFPNGRKDFRISVGKPGGSIAVKVGVSPPSAALEPRTLEQGPVETEPAASPMPDTIDVDGKERSTLNSNGKRIAQTEEGVRNFWRWFGEFGIVDEMTDDDNRPIVWYRGDTGGAKDTFTPGERRSGNIGTYLAKSPMWYFVKNPRQSERYSSGENGTTTAVYIRGDFTLLPQDDTVADWISSVGLTDKESSRIMREEQRRPMSTAEIVDAVSLNSAKGHRDGHTVFHFQDDTTGSVGVMDVAVVFNPTDIKSATGNRGTFNPEDPRIFEQRAPRQPIKRGSITFETVDGKKRTTINLFQKADLSTFLHESGHLYLEMLGDLSERQGAPQQFKDDFAAALAYLGVDRETLSKTSFADKDPRNGIMAILSSQGEDGLAKIKKIYAYLGDGLDSAIADARVAVAGVNAHEKWARTFEAYLMKGQAPSVELRGIFARFAQWLRNIYKSIRLDVELTPEVRGVMDRLLATDEEIATANQALGDDGFAANALAMGVPEERVKAIVESEQAAVQEATDRLRNEVMDEVRREDTAWWAEARAIVQKQVEDEINADKAYIAEAALRRNKTPAGEDLDTDPIKLDTNDLRRRVERRAGSKIEASAAMDRFTMMHRREGGIPLDQVAGLFGYANGDALVDGLLGLKPKKPFIEASVNAIMRQKFGDSMLDGTLADKAMDALHSDRLADLHLAQWDALLGVSTRKRRTAPIEVIRHAAQEKIRKTKAGDLAPHLYLRAEIRARRERAAALANRDAEAAITALQREILNHELYRASMDAKAQIEKNLEYARSFDDAKRRGRIGRAGGWQWTVTKPSGEAVILPTEDEARAAAALVPGSTWERTSGYLEQIDAIRHRYGFRDMSAAQLARIKSLATWVAERAAEGQSIDIPKDILEQAAKVQWRDLAVEDLAAVANVMGQIHYAAKSVNELSAASRKADFLEKSDELIQGIQSSHPDIKKPPAHDGRRSKVSKAAEDLWLSHIKAARFIRSMDGEQDNGVWWNTMVRPINNASTKELEMKWAAKERQDALWKAWNQAVDKETDGWNPSEIRAFSGWERGLDRIGAIMVALNWGNEGNRDRLMRGQKVTEGQVQVVLDSLTDADLTFIEGVWDHIESYWSEIQALEQRVHGLPPEKVEATPFQAKAGTLKGGYFPIVISDEAAPIRINGTAATWAEQMLAQAHGTAQTKQGHNKKRTGGEGQPLELDPNVIGRHISNVIHDLTHREILRDCIKILSSAPIVREIESRMGAGVVVQLKSWLGDIATEGHNNDKLSKFVGYMRRGFSASTMGFKFSTVLLQVTGFANAIKRVGPGRMIHAIGNLFAGEEGFATAHTLAKEKSAAMRMRSKTQTQEMAEIANDMRRNIVARAQQRMLMGGFWMLRKVQDQVDVATWVAAYRKASEEGQSDEDAIAIADQTVIDTQGSGLMKDLSAVQRSAVGQVFTGAFTYGSTVFNQLHEIGGELRQEWRDNPTLATMKYLYSFTMVVALPAAMTVILRDLSRPDDERKKPKGFGEKYATEILSTLLGTMVLTRELSGAFQGYQYSGPAVTKPIMDTTKLISQVRQGEIDKGLGKASLDTMGGIFGLPTGQLWATGTGIADLLDNPRLDPRPVIFGPPAKR